MRELTLGSLFTGGCGGFDLGAEWAGIRTIWQVEIDKNAHKYLAHNFPDAKRHFDIYDCGAHNLDRVDIISGGFPCQPFSTSGKRNGTKDSRYLWPEMFRIVNELRPTWVIGENVAGLRSMAFPIRPVRVDGAALVGENITYRRMEGDGVLDSICADLERAGYSVQPLLISASGIGANHRRDRIWILAHNDRDGQRSMGGSQPEGQQHEQGREAWCGAERFGTCGNAAIPSNPCLENWTDGPFEPPLCGVDDGVPDRVAKLRHLGNAVVPQIPYVIFHYISIIQTITHGNHGH